jgi:hypothetical protein
MAPMMQGGSNTTTAEAKNRALVRIQSAGRRQMATRDVKGHQVWRLVSEVEAGPLLARLDDAR